MKHIEIPSGASTKLGTPLTLREEYYAGYDYSLREEKTKRSYLFEEHSCYCQEACSPFKINETINEGEISSPALMHGRDFSLAAIKETELRDAAWFCDIFKPYLNKYSIGKQIDMEMDWKEVKRRLGNTTLQNIIGNGLEYGWFSTIVTPVIGLDIDFHHFPEGGWTVDGKPRQFLQNKYEEIVNLLGYFPTLACRSRSGLHIYYILNRPLHYENLAILLKDKISDLNEPDHIDILPSPKKPLRIPVKKWILDPATLNYLCPHLDNSIPWEAITQVKYNPEDLFGQDYRITLRSLNKKLKVQPSLKGPTSKDVKLKKILKAEAELLPFINHGSNDILNQLIPKYRSYGLTVDQSVARIQEHLTASPNYTRSLKTASVLRKRVEGFYKLKLQDYKPGCSRNVILPAHIEEIIKSQSIPTQRKNGIRMYLSGLISWKQTHDRALYDTSLMSYMNDMYPFYAVNRKQGLYPLPTSVQENWNKKYHLHLSWLTEIGILKESEYGYNPYTGRCKYYQINLLTDSNCHSTIALIKASLASE